MWKKVWNGLPSDVTSTSSLAAFKNRLETYLFRRCYETRLTLNDTFFVPVISYLPEQWIPCNTVNYLGHSKNVS